MINKNYICLCIIFSARQKKVIGSSITPQQTSPEHRVQSRRAGVSQSQRMYLNFISRQHLRIM